MTYGIILLIVLLLVACSPAAEFVTPMPATPLPTDAPLRLTQIAANPVLQVGKTEYDLRCAHCHGYSGEGQLPHTVENTLRLGMIPVPAHDSSGHTYLHGDDLLIKIIEEGVPNPLSQFPMPAFKDVLTDEQIIAVIEYMKLWWTEEQRAHQREVTAYRREMLAQASGQ
jgi:mono/diheme cytochrome c family protein